jgi:2-oxoisovalerate dehydrogenase E1 component
MATSELKMEDISAILNPAATETPLLETTLQTAPRSQLSSQTLVNAFRTMHLSRRIDDREVLLKRQNKIFFQISGAGHEAVQVAAGLLLKPGHDWVYPYYRDRALCLTLGMSPEEMFLQAFGAASDPSSGGRQMPSHWSYPELNIVTGSSPTGTQFVQAVGCAEGLTFQNPESDRIVLVCSGEGATSEGEFWEALSAACANRLPVVFLVEDNGYAISVPSERQTPGGNISALLAGFPNLFRLEIDGTDFLDSYRACSQAFAYCREHHGPALVHAHVVRPYSHSLSDDERAYKTKAERAAEAERDPITKYPQWLIDHSHIDRHGLEALIAEVDDQVQSAAQRASKAAPPAKSSVFDHLYSPTVDPTGPAFDTEPDLNGGAGTEAKTMVDLINSTLRQEMARDGRIIVFGEDVADCSREENLAEVKGKGGVFKVTAGLQCEFGSRRVFNTPIAEASITGRAIGMATAGLKPVFEIQFFDYVWPAMMQIRDEMVSLRWRSAGGWKCPLVLRIPIGGYLNGGAIYHSQCGEVIFTHNPGLRVVFPSNALDACGLLRTAIRADDPVLFLEHKRLYREPYNRSADPGPDYMIPLGKARIAKPGSSLTVITYGALVQKSLQAAMQAERRNPDSTIEIIDLRSLAPYDWETIADSVKRTSRVIVAHEDCLSFGYGAEIAARIGDELFAYLDAPVKRIGAKDTWVGYHPNLEDETLPQTENIAAEIEKLLAY